MALTYYRVLALAYDDPVLYVAFHRATLSREFARMPAAPRMAAVLAWRSFVAVTASVVAWDHREVLEAAGVGRAEFAGEVTQRARRLARALRSPLLLPEPDTVPGRS